MHLIKSENDDIYLEILPNFVSLSKTEKGLNVIKKLIIEIRWEKPQQTLINLVLANQKDFLEDFYCNYAIQLMVQTWRTDMTVSLFSLILGKIKQYSLQKSPSNVVETMIVNSDPQMRAQYLKEIKEMVDLHCMVLI